jgi:sulfatase modifying factor 1
MTNCGASSESCCASLAVAAGSYDRTYTNSGSGPTGEADPASVSAFRLDKYAVTVGRFRQFVNAVLPPGGGTGWVPAAGSGKHTHLNGGQGLANSGTAGAFETGWLASDDAEIQPTNANLSSCAPDSTWTNSAASDENLPINCVNWWESYAFCIWDGGFLPSESEWEYASAGGSEQLEYPWGAAAPGTSNGYAIYGGGPGSNTCYYPSSGACTGVANIAPVGTATLGVGRWGQLDLVGNVIEWNLDWYATYVGTCTDCAYLTSGTYRVMRGGDFTDGLLYLLPTTRSNFVPSNRYDLLGFRCARTP